ncbi:MAG: hypothetical protein ACUVTR_01350 [Dehalococcoidia bacterium]
MDPLKGNSKKTVRDLRCEDLKALCHKYSTNNHDKKPAVDVEFIGLPKHDYRPDSAFSICQAAEVLRGWGSSKPRLVAKYIEEGKNGN